jgi:hypothetical protein
MFEVDVKRVIVDLDGNEYASSKSGPEKGYLPMTLKEVYSEALVAAVRINAQDLGECTKRVNLAKKIKSAKDTVELSEEEKNLIEILVNNTYKLPLVVAQALEALEKKEG